jgi:hypothetical protein
MRLCSFRTGWRDDDGRVPLAFATHPNLDTVVQMQWCCTPPKYIERQSLVICTFYRAIGLGVHAVR